MSRSSRPVIVLRPRERWALYDFFFPKRRFLDERSHALWRWAAGAITRPSILRGAILGRRVSARAAARLLARLEMT